MSPELHLQLHRQAGALRDRDLQRSRSHALPPPPSLRHRAAQALIRLGQRLEPDAEGRALAASRS